MTINGESLDMPTSDSRLTGLAEVSASIFTLLEKLSRYRQK